MKASHIHTIKPSSAICPPWSCPQPFPSWQNPTSAWYRYFESGAYLDSHSKNLHYPTIDVCLVVMYVVYWSLLRRQFSPSLIEKGSSNWKKDLGIIIAVLGVPFHGRWSRHHISFSSTPWILLQHLVSLFCTVSGFHTENMYLSIEKFLPNKVPIGGPFEVGLPESISHSVILLFLVRRESSCNPWHSLMVFSWGRKKSHGRLWHIMWDSFTIGGSCESVAIVIVAPWLNC